jgi:hypothetical protein
MTKIDNLLMKSTRLTINNLASYFHEEKRLTKSWNDALNKTCANLNIKNLIITKNWKLILKQQ